MPDDEIASQASPGDEAGGQPTDAEPTSAAPEGASAAPPEGAEAGQPAPEGDEPPAGEGDGEPASDDLTDEDWEALYARYPERDPRTAAERAAAEARAEERRKLEQQPERARGRDPFYQAVRATAQEAAASYEAALRAIEAGDVPDDPAALRAAFYASGAWLAAEERRGHLTVNRALFEREVLGVDADHLDESDELQRTYGELLADVETRQQNAYRLRQQAARQLDAQKQADLLTRAEVTDATAVGEFYRRSIELAKQAGMREGEAKANKQAGKRIDQAAQKARQNGHTEALAKARAMVTAGRVQATGAQPGEAAPTELTLESAQRLPVSELIKIRSRDRRG